jgi:hypothetical protein
MGYGMQDHNFNSLVFVDDSVLIGATKKGVQRSLQKEMEASGVGAK